MIEVLENTKENYLANFECFEKDSNRSPRRGHSWVRQIRKVAISRFAELGFPTTRNEEWKYTNVAPIARMPFKPAEYELNGLSTAKLAPVIFKGLACTQLVFVNGHYSQKLSSFRELPTGVKVGSLAAALKTDAGAAEPFLAQYAAFSEHAFTALNTAFMEDGAFVLVPKGATVEEPIHLVFVTTASGGATISHPRNLIVVGDGSQVTLVESYAGLKEGVYFTNAVTEIVQGENAVVDYYKLQRESESAFHVATMQIHLDRNSTFASHSISLGGSLVRNDINAVLDGEGIDCTLNGLYVIGGRQHEDNHTRIEHAKPHCSSHELYKGILAGRSTGVFNGKIYVRKDAQKTDAKQTNKNLVLSENAAINTKPQLEIFADDVKCTHGATIGQLDEDAIFYLRSRGIGAEAARNMLTSAFARDIINRVKIEPIRVRLEEALSARLERESA